MPATTQSVATKAAPRARRPGRIRLPDASAAVHPAAKAPAKQSARAPRAVAAATSAPVKRGRVSPRPKPARTSALDAAARVLGGLSAPQAQAGLTAADLIDRMARSGLWTSPGGQTPSATLYAAMIREIAKRGGESRFKRIAPGRFAAASTSARARDVSRATKPVSAPRRSRAGTKGAA